jgi:hypothetical protein
MKSIGYAPLQTDIKSVEKQDWCKIGGFLGHPQHVGWMHTLPPLGWWLLSHNYVMKFSFDYFTT